MSTNSREPYRPVILPTYKFSRACAGHKRNNLRPRMTVVHASTVNTPPENSLDDTASACTPVYEPVGPMNNHVNGGFTILPAGRMENMSLKYTKPSAQLVSISGLTCATSHERKYGTSPSFRPAARSLS